LTRVDLICYRLNFFFKCRLEIFLVKFIIFFWLSNLPFDLPNWQNHIGSISIQLIFFPYWKHVKNAWIFFFNLKENNVIPSVTWVNNLVTKTPNIVHTCIIHLLTFYYKLAIQNFCFVFFFLKLLFCTTASFLDTIKEQLNQIY